MCWQGSVNCKKQVAERDIEVFKTGYKSGLFRKNFRSFFFNDFVYKSGERTPHIELTPTCGFYDKGEECMTIEEGYHSYLYYHDAIKVRENYPDTVVGCFLIPKGTGYYIDAILGGLIVSESLIFKKFV